MQKGFKIHVPPSHLHHYY